MEKRFVILLSVVSWLGVSLLFSGMSWGGDTVSLQGSSNTHKSVVEPGKKDCEKATGVALDLLGSSAGAGVESLITGKCDIAMSADRLAEVLSEVKGGKDPGNLREFVVGRVKMVVVVSKDNPISRVTGEQLRGLLTGTIESWKDLGWKDNPVVVIAAPIGAANRKIVQRDLMGGADYAPGTIDAETAAKQVEYLSVNPEGIMVVGNGTLKTAKSSEFKVIESPDISMQLSLVTKGEPTGNIKKVIDFFTGPGKQ
jgi:phosphate transport system substrate-binding protein